MGAIAIDVDISSESPKSGNAEKGPNWALLLQASFSKYHLQRSEFLKLPIFIFVIEFGPCPIYAHGSSFSPKPGIMIMVIVSRAKIIIIIVNRIINYNCNSDYITHESTLKTKYMTLGQKFFC